VLISSPQILTRVPGVGARIPPSYNVIISNVPGPRQRLYFLGAEMEAYYPISALAHGQALHITVLSYAGGLYFGFTACHDRVPSVQRLAVYTGEALDELEHTFMKAGRQRAPKGAEAKPSAPRKRTAGPRKSKSVAARRASKRPARRAKSKG
jgi:diacylglycerol O-acyltransferase